ncbi:MAG: MBL fold metallo-hydrolase, partial [Ilumatobacteraceae bacterium]
MSVSGIEVVWLGHATTEVHLGRTRFVTDPVLRDRVAHLRRRRGTVSLAPGPVDAVLLSHLHHDHLD